MDFLPEGQLVQFISLLWQTIPISSAVLLPAVLGFRRLLGDILVFFTAYVYIYFAYQAILVARHAA
jgi:hypothetical protein